MKIYEYANKRKIKSKDVVKKLHEMGFDFVKNHLSLVPEKVLDELDGYDFNRDKKEKKNEMKSVAIVSMVYNNQVKGKLESKNYGRKIVILPKLNLSNDFEVFTEYSISDVMFTVYRFNKSEIDYYLIDFKVSELGHGDESKNIATFCSGVIQLFETLDVPFDIINIHDWPLGLFPILFENQLRVKMKQTIIEFTVYGSTYQGIYGIEVLKDFGISNTYFDDHTVEYARSVNLLKAGLVTANKVDLDQDALSDLKNSYLKSYVYDNM